jgi:hypothetical protein
VLYSPCVLSCSGQKIKDERIKAEMKKRFVDQGYISGGIFFPVALDVQNRDSCLAVFTAFLYMKENICKAV